MYQVYTFNYENGWRFFGAYDRYDVAKWHIDNCIVNPNACIADGETGEVLFEKTPYTLVY